MSFDNKEKQKRYRMKKKLIEEGNKQRKNPSCDRFFQVSDNRYQLSVIKVGREVSIVFRQGIELCPVNTRENFGRDRP